MKILKYLLFLILLVIIGSAIYFGTKEGDYEIADSITIAAPTEVVFEKVNDLKTWEVWMPKRADDSDQVYSYAEKSSGEGASLSWGGKQAASVSTVKVIPNSEIVQEFTFNSPAGKRTAEMYWTFETMGDSTKVSWTTKGKHTLTDKAYRSIIGSNFDDKIQERNRKGLSRLSAEVIADMKKYTIHVDGITQYGGGYYMYTTSVAKEPEVLEKSRPMMKMVKDFVSRNNLNASGRPFILYNEIDPTNNTVIFSTCVPLKEKVITPENSPVVSGFMEPVSALKVSLKGNYDHLPQALEQGMEYMKENDLQVDSSRKIFEVFVTDAEKEPNPAKWVTELYIPVVSKDNAEESEI